MWKLVGFEWTLSTEGGKGKDLKIIKMAIRLASKCRSLDQRGDKKLSGVSRRWLSDRLIGEGLEMLADPTLC